MSNPGERVVLQLPDPSASCSHDLFCAYQREKLLLPPFPPQLFSRTSEVAVYLWERG